MRRALAFATLVTTIAAAAAVPAFANHSWNGYHWARTGNPFTLKVGDNLSSTWKPYLQTTSSDWSKSTMFDTSIATGAATGKCRPTSGRVEVCNGSYGNNGWLGLAQVWVSSSHITQGTVKVNDTYFSTPTYNTPSERNHVMCQEVGHTLGLDHQDTSGASLGTCMDYSSSLSSQHPNQHDYDELVTIYGSHADSFTTIGSASAGRLPDAVPSWAQASRRGKAVFVDDLGGGVQLVTFVVWADKA